MNLERQKKLAELPPIREILKKHEIFTKKSLGQHFLFDLNITDKIARHAGSLKNCTVIEIGPGPAPLTRSLLKCGAEKLMVIEKDERLKALRAELGEIAGPDFKVVFGDALEVNETELTEAPRKIVANLPYNVGTALILKWLENINAFENITVMIQKEVADRLAAEPGNKDYGRLSVITQWLCEVRHDFDVPPSAFIPPPKVTSSVVTLVPRKEPLAPANKEILEKVCKAAFGQRRKMLKKSLGQITDNAEEILQKASVDGTLRAEKLTVQDFCALARAFEVA